MQVKKERALSMVYEMPPPSDFQGKTLMVVFGKYAGFHIRYRYGIYGILLGRIAITYIPCDVENVIGAWGKVIYRINDHGVAIVKDPLTVFEILRVKVKEWRRI